MYPGKIIGLVAIFALAACSSPTNGGALPSERPDESPPPASSAIKSMPDPDPHEAPAESPDRQQASTTVEIGGLRQSYYECAQAGDGSTWSMQECVEDEAKYQDARLNKVYQALRSKLSGERKEKLKVDERKWLADRNSKCSWDATEGGQGQRIEANICSLKMTAERAAELEGILANIGI